MIFRSIFVASYLLGVVHKAAPCPEVPDGGCSVCGIGKCVQAPSSVDLSAILPKAMLETMTTCGDVQQAGYEAYRDSTIELCGNSGAEFLATSQFASVCDCQTTMPQSDLVSSSYLERAEAVRFCFCFCFRFVWIHICLSKKIFVLVNDPFPTKPS